MRAIKLIERVNRLLQSGKSAIVKIERQSYVDI